MTSETGHDTARQPGAGGQGALDAENADFWDELCGSSLARKMGVTDASAESLARFDAAYLGHYPYLAAYLPSQQLRDTRVLEIGLGYGTLSGQLLSRGAHLEGVDIAAGPVEIVRHRIRLAAQDPSDRVVQGTALDLPHESDRFDFVYSIGCLHHTGNLPRSVAEVRRVLKPGGTAVVMPTTATRRAASSAWRSPGSSAVGAHPPRCAGCTTRMQPGSRPRTPTT